MQGHKFLFALYLSELIFMHTDKLLQTLQEPKLSNVEGHGIAMLVVETRKGHEVTSYCSFDAFWEKVEQSRESLGLDEPSCLASARLQLVSKLVMGPVIFRLHPAPVFRGSRSYAVATIQENFNQEGFKMLCSVEQLLMKACILATTLMT